MLEFGLCLRNNVELDTKTNGVYPLHLACILNHEMALALIEAGASPNVISDIDLATPLMVASASGDITLVKALIDVGAEVDIVDRRGNTAILAAAEYNHAEILEILCLRTKHINHANENPGDTALHIATRRGYLACTNILLKYGADPHTVLDSMHSIKDEEIYRIVNDAINQ